MLRACSSSSAARCRGSRESARSPLSSRDMRSLKDAIDMACPADAPSACGRTGRQGWLECTRCRAMTVVLMKPSLQPHRT